MHIIKLMPHYNKNPPKKQFSAFSTGFDFGGDEEDRTLDLTDANRTLSQLSYAPICITVYTLTQTEGKVKWKFQQKGQNRCLPALGYEEENIQLSVMLVAVLEFKQVGYFFGLHNKGRSISRVLWRLFL